MHVLVAGGSGFLGRSVCRVLAERGHTVTAASRSPASDLPGGVTGVTMDVTRPDLDSVVGGHDAVVNCVALPSHRTPPPGSGGHDRVHRAGTEHLVRAAERTGVERFVQVSALGVDAGVDTAYFRAKRAAEDAVRAADLSWVIYRPSVVFGDGCAFLPFLRRLTPPVVGVLPGGGTRIQPIWVEDLAPMVAAGVTDPEHAGATYDLGGPERLTLAETVRLVAGVRAVLPVPTPMAAVGARVAEALPGVPIDRDQYRVLGLNNTVADNEVAAFGVAESDLLTLGGYLAGEVSRP